MRHSRTFLSCLFLAFLFVSSPRNAQGDVEKQSHCKVDNELTKLLAIRPPKVNRRNGLVTATLLRNVTSLEGLECFPEIESLTGNGTAITSFDGLEVLKNLKKLHWLFQKIEDIQALSKLTNLEVLDLGSNPIKDHSPIGTLKSLKNLRVPQTGLSDLSIFGELPKLERLDINGNQVSDLNPIKYFPKLKALFALGNKISNIDPLTNLKHLSYAALAGNQIKVLPDLSALAPTLRVLGMAGNQISDVRPLVVLTNLTELNLQENKICDFRPLDESKISFTGRDQQAGECAGQDDIKDSFYIAQKNGFKFRYPKSLYLEGDLDLESWGSARVLKKKTPKFPLEPVCGLRFYPSRNDTIEEADVEAFAKKVILRFSADGADSGVFVTEPVGIKVIEKKGETIIYEVTATEVYFWYNCGHHDENCNDNTRNEKRTQRTIYVVDLSKDKNKRALVVEPWNDSSPETMALMKDIAKSVERIK